MPKSIAELRASGRVRRRTRDHTLCLDVDLADEYRRLREELFVATAALEEKANQPQPPGRLGTRAKAALQAEREQVEELAAQLDAIADQMAEFEVTVTVEQAETEAWNDWAAENPPREQEPDELGRRALILRDAQHGGRVNFDALVKALPTWVIGLNGAPVAAGDWEWVASNASPADLDDLAGVVLELHTGRVSLPKSLRDSLATLIDGFVSESLKHGAPAPVGSTAGSPSGRRPTSTTSKDA